MSKWSVQVTGIQWLVDMLGRVVGYRDKNGVEWTLTQTPMPANTVESADVPAGLTAKLAALRANIEAAARSNYQTALPLVALPAWTSGGTVFTNQVFASGGNTWFVISGGVMSTTAPTVPTNPADRVTSGTATLAYVGASKPVAATGPDTPTVADANSSSGVTGMREFSPQSSQSAFTFTAALNLINHYAGVAAVSGFNASTSYFGDTSVPALIGRMRSLSQRMGFVTMSKRVMVQSGSNLANLPVFIEVNGSPVKELGVHYTGTGPNPGGVLLTFPDRRRRTIWLGAPAGGFDWLSVWVDTADTVMPADAGAVRLVCEGDSLTQGGNNTPYYWRGDWPSQLADFCGIRDVWNMAIGGTGLLAPGGNCSWSDPRRLAYVIAAKPDILMLAGDHNDTAYTSADRVPAMLAYLRAIRAGCPNTLILWFGTTMLRDEVTSSFTQIDADIQTAIAQFRAAGGDNVSFIPALTASPESWIVNGAGAPYYLTSGDGHPAQLGVDYLAARYTAAFQNWLTKNVQ